MIKMNSSNEQLFKIAETGKAITSIIFSLRIVIAINIQREIFEPLDFSRSGEMTGSVLGAASLGAAISLMLGSVILDLTGIRFLFSSSCFTTVAGILMVVLGNTVFDGYTVYWILWLGMLLMGIGIGSIEAGANPLVATIYPEDKQHRMNRLQSWWPMGIAIGGVLGFALNKIGILWQVQMGLTMLPMLGYWIMLKGVEFPVTRRVEQKVSQRAMYREAIRPAFFMWLVAMLFIGSTEQVPSNWIDLAYTPSLEVKGIVILIYVNLLMFGLRYFAGPLAGRLSTHNLLLLSSVVSCGGLVLMAHADSLFKALVFATVWGAGVAYLWPTAVAAVADRFPKGGALLIGLMGTVGSISIFLVLPLVGKIYDATRIKEAGGIQEAASLAGEPLRLLYYQMAKMSFLSMALLPLGLFGILLIIRLRKA